MKTGLRLIKVHPFFTTAIVLFLLLMSITIGQMIEPAPSPSQFFPDGAVIYVQAKDFQHLVDEWTSSEIKSNWEASKNYQQFQNSRLYMKLQDRISKWGAGGKFTFTWENLARSAGSTTGVALYDIGELKAIAATQIPFAKAKATELWLARTRFAEKKSGSRTYYVEPRQGILAFAYVEPYLILSTDESLLTRALDNLNEPSRTLDQSPKWIACRKQQNSDLSMFVDQETLQKNRYFNRYWIHRNVKDFADIRAVWMDLVLKSDSVEERRYFVSSSSQTNADESAIQDFVREFRKFRHDALSYDAGMDASAAADSLLKFINRFADPYERTSYPPTFSGAAERAAQADSQNILLEQIDEPILQVKSETLLQASAPEQLSNVIAPAEPVAQIKLGYPLWDNQALFARFPQTLFVQLKTFSALNQQTFLDILLQHFLLLHSTQEEGARWKAEGNGNFTLQSMRPVYVRFQDPWIVISNEEADFRQVIQNLPPAMLPPPGSYSELNWNNSRWKYKRLMTRLDHGLSGDDTTPLFFSENIASLLDALAPVSESSVEKFANQEIVKYELRK
jgi:hypothetical protein